MLYPFSHAANTIYTIMFPGNKAAKILCCCLCGISGFHTSVQAQQQLPSASDNQTHAPDNSNSVAPISNSIETSLPKPLVVAPISFNEPYDSGWQLYFDNDLFIGSNTDRDYTGGFALAFGGRRASDWWFSLDSWLDHIDRLSGIEQLQRAADGFSRHTIEFGLVMFTPENLSISIPQFEDHPYSNFLFLANSQQVTYPNKRWTLQSALTIGVIGTNAGPEVQNLIHATLDSEKPNGWDNQISDGGELTGRYSVTAQKNLIQHHGAFSFELSTSFEGNIGINTDFAVSLVTRLGQLSSPWWSFLPHQSDYINLGQAITGRFDERIMPAEFFMWAGVKAKYSVYNGFLQGQFRHSAVRFDHDELESGITEAWLGVTKTWTKGFGLSFFVRNRSGQITGPQNRDALWSGFIVSYTG